MAFDPSKYTVAKARPLPVILLLDRSDSMGGEKISTLNSAVNEMIESFKSAGQGEVEINLGIISFGDGGATYDLPLQPVSGITQIALSANGGTPMGMALKMAKDLIEDKETIPSKGYRPAVVLVSDGAPNDNWQQPMENFISGGRSSKCERFAMAIGTSQEDPVLNKFLSGTENKVFLANEASKIRDFFKFVTMSVSVRSRSQNPNALLPAASNPSSLTAIEDMAKEFGLDL
ncbi:MAG: VWA domain-containing protein [Treponema sp.]|nr:VWA domain-containing protein [Treponema sp.]